MQACLDLECGFYFVMDSVITLTSDEVLKDLVHWNRSVITTQLTQPGQVNLITLNGFINFLIRNKMANCYLLVLQKAG